MKIFISYSNKNSDIAFEVCDFLEKNNNHCFIAPRDIRTGFSYAEEIMRGIDSTDILVLLLSAESNDSPHVLREVERAVNARVPIITYKIGEVSLSKSFEYFLMPSQWLEMTEDRNHAQLLDAIDILLANDECSDELYYEDGFDDITDSSEKNNLSGNRNTKKLYAFIAAAIAVIVILAVVIAVVSIKSRNTSNLDYSNGSLNANADTNNDLQNGDNSGNNAGDTNNGTEYSGVNISDYSVGMTVTFGKYLGEDIEWSILNIDENGCAEMISSYVITMKAYDSAESGRSGYTSDGRTASYYEQYTNEEYSEMYGSSLWSTSNLRTWLNSADADVYYADSAPIASGMNSGCNEYDSEPGFLYNFSEKEIAALVLTSNETRYYGPGSYDLSQKEFTSDYVYLLASNEVTKLTDAGMSFYTKPTEAAIRQNKSSDYLDSQFDDSGLITYWLRDTSGSSNAVVCMWNGYFDSDMLMGEFANHEGLGVRPVVTVDLNSNLVKIIE